MSSLRGSIRFSPSPRATAVDFLLANSELATCCRADFERFWRVWLEAPRLQTLRLEFACTATAEAPDYEGINRFLEFFVNNVLFQTEHKVGLSFHLSNWTELDEKKMSVKEVLEAPVQLYDDSKQTVQFVEADMFHTQFCHSSSA
jgi:hypothetical protein